MRIFKHPLHAMLVHFPVASWSLATACDGLALAGFTQAWSYAWLLLAVGLISAVPAMIAGAIDLAKLDDVAERDGNRHMILMGSAWTVYLCAMLARLDDMTPVLEPQFVSIALSVVGFGLMMAGGWYGGQLVYHHGAGVKRGD